MSFKVRTFLWICLEMLAVSLCLSLRLKMMLLSSAWLSLLTAMSISSFLSLRCPSMHSTLLLLMVT